MGLSDSKFHGFVGEARPITENEIAAAAKAMGVKWSRLHGVMEVEASFTRPGQGFDRFKRPKMLFEPHHFYRALRIRKPGSLAPAVSMDLARTGQPPHSWYGRKSYARLVKALELDETSALLACSWGFGQVMGFNWKIAGFSSVQDMVFQCMDSEAAHLQAMCGYIRHVPACLNGLRTGNAASFAKGYNGANYAAGGYHTKIAVAWRKWERMPFPRTGADAVGAENIQPEEDRAMPESVVRDGETLPADLQPKPQLSSTAIQGTLVSAVFKMIGFVVAAKYPNLQGTWEQWALLMTPFAVSLVGDVMAYVGTLGRTAPIAGTRGAEKFRDALDDILEQRSATIGTSLEPVEEPPELAPAVDTPPVPVALPEFVMGEALTTTIKRMPLEDVLTQLPEVMRMLGGLMAMVRQAQEGPPAKALPTEAPAEAAGFIEPPPSPG